MAAAAAASASHRAAPTAIFPSHTGRGRAGGGKSAGSAGRMCRPQQQQEEAMLAPFCLRSPARPPSPRAQAGPGGGRCGLGGAAGPPPPPPPALPEQHPRSLIVLRRRRHDASPPPGLGAAAAAWCCPAAPGMERRRLGRRCRGLPARGATRCSGGAAMEPPVPSPRAIGAAAGFLKVAAAAGFLPAAAAGRAKRSASIQVRRRAPRCCARCELRSHTCFFRARRGEGGSASTRAAGERGELSPNAG